MQTIVDQDAVSAESYLVGVRAILDRVRSAAPEIEAGRQLTPEVVELMRDAKMFAAAVPREWGGPELDAVTIAHGIELLATADASAGWCAMIGSDTGFVSAFLDDHAARQLFSDPFAATVWVLNPTGAAVPAEGGYLVTGRWPFASGSKHAPVYALGCVVPAESGVRMRTPETPEVRVVVVPAAQAEIIDTWTTTGVRGSGSHDVALANVFVPAEHTFAMFDQPSRRPGPLYVMSTLFISKMGGAVLGVARGAIDDVLTIAKTKKPLGNTVPIAEQPWLQAEVARAEMKLGQARAFYYESLQELWNHLRLGKVPPLELRARLHLSIIGAHENAMQVVDSMYKAAGSSALYSRGTLDRRLRDIHTIGQHVTFSQGGVSAIGKVVLGLPVPWSPFLAG